ncbi:MAG: WYL domain-containing protein [Polyangiaceae bacterium]|nr:WYL domain-containing protein [Polyangiaceae bacterium]
MAVGEAARELGCTTRTIYRDLAVLESTGVPLYQDPDDAQKRWRIMEGHKRRLSLTLTFAEMLALSTGRDLLAGLAGTVFHEAAISALEKIRSAVPKEISQRAAAATRQISALSGASHDHRRSHAVIEKLLSALERRETVELVYRKPRQQHPSRRLVNPYHLHVQAGALYLIGFCHKRRQVRTFLVNRAVSVEKTGQFFTPREHFSASPMLQGSFGPWSGHNERVHLRFSAQAAPFVAEKKIHPSQRLDRGEDGTLGVELEIPVGPPLVAWFLSFGAEVSVLQPKALADRVRKEHRRAAEAAQKKSERL